MWWTQKVRRGRPATGPTTGRPHRIKLQNQSWTHSVHGQPTTWSTRSVQWSMVNPPGPVRWTSREPTMVDPECGLDGFLWTHGGPTACFKTPGPAWYATSSSSGRRRRRTIITASERHALESEFAVESRPSSERISRIADTLGLSKSGVRVWYCNQRQKQKRLKYCSEVAASSSSCY